MDNELKQKIKNYEIVTDSSRYILGLDCYINSERVTVGPSYNRLVFDNRNRRVKDRLLDAFSPLATYDDGVSLIVTEGLHEHIAFIAGVMSNNYKHAIISRITERTPVATSPFRTKFMTKITFCVNDDLIDGVKPMPLHQMQMGELAESVHDIESKDIWRNQLWSMVEDQVSKSTYQQVVSIISDSDWRQDFPKEEYYFVTRKTTHRIHRSYRGIVLLDSRSRPVACGIDALLRA